MENRSSVVNSCRYSGDENLHKELLEDKIIREAADLYPGQFGPTDYSSYSLDDLEHKHNQMMGSLDGQVGRSTTTPSDIELAGEEIVDIRIQMAKLRAEQGLPEKDYSSNTYHEAERVAQGEIKFRKRGY